MRAGAGIDRNRQRIAADDAARRMHDDRLADVGAFGVERLLHPQRTDVPTCRQHRSRGLALEAELETRLPSARRGAPGQRRSAASGLEDIVRL